MFMLHPLPLLQLKGQVPLMTLTGDCCPHHRSLNPHQGPKCPKERAVVPLCLSPSWAKPGHRWWLSPLQGWESKWWPWSRMVAVASSSFYTCSSVVLLAPAVRSLLSSLLSDGVTPQYQGGHRTVEAGKGLPGGIWSKPCSSRTS